MPRPGYITASVFNDVMTKTFGKTVLKACCRIACERLGVRDLEEQFDISGLRAIEWGNEMEPLARAAYESERFATIEGYQDWFQIEGRMVGGHVDGRVGSDGIVEIKCPNSDNHLLNITRGEQLGDYIYQIQAYLWITGRDWCDFVSFDPRFPGPLQLHVVRVERDEDLIAAIDQRAAEMETIISEMVDSLRTVPDVDVAAEELQGPNPLFERPSVRPQPKPQTLL